MLKLVKYGSTVSVYRPTKRERERKREREKERERENMHKLVGREKL